MTSPPISPGYTTPELLADMGPPMDATEDAAPYETLEGALRAQADAYTEQVHRIPKGGQPRSGQIPDAEVRIGVSTAMLVEQEGRILTGFHRKHGLLVVPSGHIELGEPHYDTAVREVEEETGLRVQPTEVLGVYETIERDDAYRVTRHHLFVLWRCALAGGVLKGRSDELSDIDWRDRDAIQGLVAAGRVSRPTQEVFYDLGWIRRLVLPRPTKPAAPSGGPGVDLGTYGPSVAQQRARKATRETPSREEVERLRAEMGRTLRREW